MILDASPILPYLWQGAAPRLSCEVKRNGFDALVLCAEEFQPPSSEFPGVFVIHAPLDDTLSPTIEEMTLALRTARGVANMVRSGKSVLVTCMMGWNRSGLVNALAVRELLGCSGREAVRTVQKARKGALGNTSFFKMVAALPGRKRTDGTSVEEL